MLEGWLSKVSSIMRRIISSVEPTNRMKYIGSARLRIRTLNRYQPELLEQLAKGSCNKRFSSQAGRYCELPCGSAADGSTR
ncbi:MAG: hypothetical protein R3B96_11565 [Pirellulaceae bacterium]